MYSSTLIWAALMCPPPCIQMTPTSLFIYISIMWNNIQFKKCFITFLGNPEVTTTTATMTTVKSTFSTEPTTASVNVINDITTTPSTTSHGEY